MKSLKPIGVVSRVRAKVTGVEYKGLSYIVVDEDYEGLLSSYIESDAWRKMMFHRCFDPEMTKAELADHEEKASTEKDLS